MKIVLDDLRGSDIAEFLEEHLREMKAVSPPESVHALDLDRLREPDITFWTVRDHDTLLACGAIKELDPTHGEIKSMRTLNGRARQGVASFLLRHMIEEARSRSYQWLSLETGSMAFFAPARAFYSKFGFEYRGPFGAYSEDPHSVFMSKRL